MRLVLRPEPFDHPDWIYEVKFDGFRALAYIEDGACRLVSRRNHEYKSFRELRSAIAEVSVQNAVIDGEIVCLDPDGRSNFYDLMSRCGRPHFYAFDLLWLNGEDLRSLPLLERKRQLRKLLCTRLQKTRVDEVRYLNHLEEKGSGLFKMACRWDLEGIVAKWKDGIYGPGQKRSTWVKIKNPAYSQTEWREELFERP